MKQIINWKWGEKWMVVIALSVGTHIIINGLILGFKPFIVAGLGFFMLTAIHLVARAGGAGE